jgi:hypothetical protein
MIKHKTITKDGVKYVMVITDDPKYKPSPRAKYQTLKEKWVQITIGGGRPDNLYLRQTMKTYNYFVSYAFDHGYGNAFFAQNVPMSQESMQILETRIAKENTNGRKVVVTNFILLSVEDLHVNCRCSLVPVETPLEYARRVFKDISVAEWLALKAGDEIYSVRRSGNSITKRVVLKNSPQGIITLRKLHGAGYTYYSRYDRNQFSVLADVTKV